MTLVRKKEKLFNILFLIYIFFNFYFFFYKYNKLKTDYEGQPQLNKFITNYYT